MSDPALGLLMLTLIVIVIIDGLPDSVHLNGLAYFSAYIAFYDRRHSWAETALFDLMFEPHPTAPDTTTS